MPVTLKTAPHDSNSATLGSKSISSPDDLLPQLPGDHSKIYRRVHESSLSGVNTSENVYASAKGFVGAATKAYNEHLHLILRPDDVWIAIVTQLSFYINGHSEELRHLFVAHEGKNELYVQVDKTGDGDFERLIGLMSHLIERNIIDASFREWILPNFSTSTPTDHTVCSVVLMGALKNYFEYKFGFRCGIPSVTLLGEKQDWESLRAKLWRLPSLGVEPGIWSKQLDQVVGSMITCFDTDKQAQSIDFWQKIAHFHNMGSGLTYLSGSITAFCFWSSEGKLLYNEHDMKDLGLDRVLFHRIDYNKVRTATVEVPVKVEDLTERREYETCILAGCSAYQGSVSKDATSRGSTEIDTLQPMSTWLIYELKPGDVRTREK